MLVYSFYEYALIFHQQEYNPSSVALAPHLPTISPAAIQQRAVPVPHSCSSSAASNRLWLLLCRLYLLLAVIQQRRYLSLTCAVAAAAVGPFGGGGYQWFLSRLSLAAIQQRAVHVPLTYAAAAATYAEQPRFYRLYIQKPSCSGRCLDARSLCRSNLSSRHHRHLSSQRVSLQSTDSTALGPALCQQRHCLPPASCLGTPPSAASCLSL